MPPALRWRPSSGAARVKSYGHLARTESNNLAIKGAIELAATSRRRIVTAATEHKAVLDPVEWIARLGSPVTVLDADRNGLVRLSELEAVLSKGDTALVSLMAANNETGVLADLPTLAALAHHYGALFHTDATQAVARIPVDVHRDGIDLLSLSAHKFYGPKGVGALFVSRRTGIAPLIHGGGHENGLRSGTLNVPGIVGLGAAASRAEDLWLESDRQSQLIGTLVERLQSYVDGVIPVLGQVASLPGTTNLRFVGADADAVMANAPRVAVSSGSACTARVPAPSHVLLAMGLSSDEAHECLRFSVGRPTTIDEVEAAASAVAAAVERVRKLSQA